MGESPEHPLDPRVEVLTRDGCHLCAAALARVSAICAETSSAYVEVDVDAAPELTAEYGWDVPVIRVDGRVLCVHRVEEQRLRAALAAEPGSWRPW